MSSERLNPDEQLAKAREALERLDQLADNPQTLRTLSDEELSEYLANIAGAIRAAYNQPRETGHHEDPTERNGA